MPSVQDVNWYPERWDGIVQAWSSFAEPSAQPFPFWGVCPEREGFGFALERSGNAGVRVKGLSLAGCRGRALLVFGATTVVHVLSFRLLH